MNRARDSNMPAITELLAPNADAGRNAREFVLYLPIYLGGRAVDSIEQRRLALVGFVFSRLSPDVIFSDSIAAATVRYLDIAIYDSRKTPMRCSSGLAKAKEASSRARAVHRRPAMASGCELPPGQHRGAAARGATDLPCRSARVAAVVCLDARAGARVADGRAACRRTAHGRSRQGRIPRGAVARVADTAERDTWLVVDAPQRQRP